MISDYAKFLIAQFERRCPERGHTLAGYVCTKCRYAISEIAALDLDYETHPDQTAKQETRTSLRDTTPKDSR